MFKRKKSQPAIREGSIFWELIRQAEQAKNKRAS